MEAFEQLDILKKDCVVFFINLIIYLAIFQSKIKVFLTLIRAF